MLPVISYGDLRHAGVRGSSSSLDLYETHLFPPDSFHSPAEWVSALGATPSQVNPGRDR